MGLYLRAYANSMRNIACKTVCLAINMFGALIFLRSRHQFDELGSRLYFLQDSLTNLHYKFYKFDQQSNHRSVLLRCNR